MIHRLIAYIFIDSVATKFSPLSLHDALPISPGDRCGGPGRARPRASAGPGRRRRRPVGAPPGPGQGVLRLRSEEHTSELQSRENLVCRLLLEKKKNWRKKRLRFKLSIA